MPNREHYTDELPKAWWKSRTHLTQVVGAISSVCAVWFGWAVLSPDEIATIVLMIQLAVHVATMVIRQYTNKAVTSIKTGFKRPEQVVGKTK